MKTVSVTQFKAHCLEMISEVEKSGDSVLLTKRGKPTALLGPAPQERKGWVLGQFRETNKILGNLVEPFDEPWEALL